MNQKQKLLGCIGLAMKAGALKSGETMTEEAIRSGKAKLCFVACDASDNTKKKFSDHCSYYHVPLVMCLTKEEMGKAVGKEYRASIAVTDKGFADLLRKKLD